VPLPYPHEVHEEEREEAAVHDAREVRAAVPEADPRHLATAGSLK
jgi:hypothetical protein